MELKISTFNELINAIEQNDFNKKELALLLWHTLKIVAIHNSKAELILLLKEHWSKWKDAAEKPLFVGLEIQEITFDKMLENSAFKKEVDKLEAMY
jgi:hypothetical protein